MLQVIHQEIYNSGDIRIVNAVVHNVKFDLRYLHFSNVFFSV